MMPLMLLLLVLLLWCLIWLLLLLPLLLLPFLLLLVLLLLCWCRCCYNFSTMAYFNVYPIEFETVWKRPSANKHLYLQSVISITVAIVYKAIKTIRFSTHLNSMLTKVIDGAHNYRFINSSIRRNCQNTRFHHISISIWQYNREFIDFNRFQNGRTYSIFCSFEKITTQPSFSVTILYYKRKSWNENTAFISFYLNCESDYVIQEKKKQLLIVCRKFETSQNNMHAHDMFQVVILLICLTVTSAQRNSKGSR